MDSDLIGVALKMSVENFLELGCEKIFRNFPNATELALREAAQSPFKRNTCKQAPQAVPRDRFQTCIPVHGDAGLLLERGSRYRRQFHELRGNN